MVGEAAEAHEYSRRLFEGGLLATGIGFPTVPKGKARVRTIVTSEHTQDHLDQAAKLLVATAKAMGFAR